VKGRVLLWDGGARARSELPPMTPVLMDICIIIICDTDGFPPPTGQGRILFQL
jgi:hypothetical protein